MTIDKPKLLLVGNNVQVLDDQKQIVGSGINGYDVTVRMLSGDESKPISDNKEMPDILVFNLSDHAGEEITQLAEVPSGSRPPFILIGSENNQQLMRRAMQIGARDFITWPVDPDEFLSCLKRVHNELIAQRRSKGSFNVFINAKGGSGATFLASNLAYLTQVTSPDSVALLDLDLQFGSLALQLDMSPEHNMLEALNEVERVDGEALDGYMAKHKSGLRLLTTLDGQLMLPGEVSVDRIEKLINLTQQYYNHVIADLPRQIDPVTAAALESADRVVVVLQQSLVHLRDANLMNQILTRELAIPRENIFFVINRYNWKSTISKRDVIATLDSKSVLTVPNDYQRVAEALNLGIPMYDYARKSDITQSFIGIADTLGLTVKNKRDKKSFLKRIFHS